MNDIRPLKEVVQIRDVRLWPLILLILAMATAIAIFLYLRRRKGVSDVASRPQKSPEEIAKEKLKLLLEERLAEKGMTKEYYIRLSDIVRLYIEQKYGIASTDMTTWELYQEMRLRRIDRQYVDKARDFLEDCDLVKFAKYVPSQKEIEQAYTRAEEIACKM